MVAPPSFATLRVSVDGTVGTIELARPDRLNPLGTTALRELADAAAFLDGTDASVVVVRGAGRAFSAGFDLRELEHPEPDPAGRSTAEVGAAMAEAVASMRAVTVARIQGPCVGGGLVLALCCDLRVAADDAWCSLPETELAIPLAWSGVPRLVREIGPSRALDLVLTARRVPAAEALALGLVNRVVAPDELDGAVDELVAVLAARRPDVVATTKAQVSQAADALVPTDGTWAGTELLEAALRRLVG
ncbi:MAG: enoyl-CoA hydratase/isomerase family protein [Acidimicrobiales bacterium]|nr:enoyl-CoA hydratase/isomerase family protein [Acidimicrobiales bacterium]